MRRIDALRERLTRLDLDALLLTHLPNVRYLSGFTGSAALLLVNRDDARLLTDFRYETQAEEEVHDEITAHIAADGLLAALAGHLSERPGLRRIGFEADRVTVRDRREFGEMCGGVMWEPLVDEVEALRAVKDATEIASIQRAAELADEALRFVLEHVSEGMTEKEIASSLDYRMRTLGSDASAFETIVASGPRSALPHARPTDRRIRRGDFLLIDFGATWQGYCSDMTRMVTVGPADEWQRSLHGAVTVALEQAIDAISAGRLAREIDSAARGSLEQSGLAEHFGHSTGHGIGLEVHEAPRLHHRSTEALASGNVVTVEPGVYFPGRGGVRIEEDVVVQDGCCTVLTGFPRDLTEI